MSFKIDMSKFRKMASDKDHTTLQHEDGHQIKIAHGALSRGHRKQLESLPMMSEGGKVSDVDHPTSTIQPERRINLDPEKVKQFQSNSIFNSTGKKLKNTTAYNQADGGSVKMAEGGKVTRKLDIEETGPVEAEMAADNDLEFVTHNKKKKLDIEPIKMADGGDVIDYDNLVPKEQNQKDAEDAPYGVPLEALRSKVATATNNTAPQDGQSVNMGSIPIASTPQASNETTQPVASKPSPVEQAPVATATETKQPATKPIPSPDLVHAYESQVSGIEAEAQAQAAKAAEEKQAITRQVGVMSDLTQTYQKHYNELENERKAFQDDIANTHIDPNRYLGSMDTAGRITTAIGLALGGLGSSIAGGPNTALEFLNKQIDRDIDAQRATLGKKESLLSANLRQFGNMKDATDMTKIMQNDLLVNQLKQAEAKAASPAAKARAQQLIATKEAEIAPLMQQLTLRRQLTASGGRSGDQGQGRGLSEVDPSTLVPSVVPEHHQEAVYKELERAQNTKQVAQTALKNFDEVTQQMKSAGGLGRLKTAAYSPAQLQALEAELGTTVGDMEGTVREAAMHNVKSAYLPRSTDSDERLAERRAELANYLKLKAAAPRAKSFGIDVSKFDSTSKNLGPSLSPQQQSFANWGKQNANSSDPATKAKALAVLKKLGLQ